jgi:aryl-alcohol dehydrogenase-like predicted oxidoreductase
LPALPALAADRLILGTAQFGMPYGITNGRGQVSAREVDAILLHAQDAGVTVIDTAAGYGTSEETLGLCLSGLPCFKVITKIPSVSSETVAPTDVQRIRDSVFRSLDRLRRDKVDGLLVHHAADLLKPGGEKIVELLESLKREGTTARLGVSVYDAEEIDRVLKVVRPDIMQIPINLFDQRLMQSGHLASLREAEIEIHGRSAFLQGVLLADPSRLPDYFGRFADQFELYGEFIGEHKLSRLAACLGFMFEQSGVDRIIVGVTLKSELAEILAAVPGQSRLPRMNKLACSDAALVDPRRWGFLY